MHENVEMVQAAACGSLISLLLFLFKLLVELLDQSDSTESVRKNVSCQVISLQLFVTSVHSR